MEPAFVGLQRPILHQAYGFAGLVKCFLRPRVDGCPRHRQQLNQADEARFSAGNRARACRSSLPSLRLHSPASPENLRSSFVSCAIRHARACFALAVFELARVTQASNCSRAGSFEAKIRALVKTAGGLVRERGEDRSVVNAAKQRCGCFRAPHFGSRPAGYGATSGSSATPCRPIDATRRTYPQKHRQQALFGYEPAVAVETADYECTTQPRLFPWTLIGTLLRPRF